jgi:hypothetical protein
MLIMNVSEARASIKEGLDTPVEDCEDERTVKVLRLWTHYE